MTARALIGPRRRIHWSAVIAWSLTIAGVLTSPVVTGVFSARTAGILTALGSAWQLIAPKVLRDLGPDAPTDVPPGHGDATAAHDEPHDEPHVEVPTFPTGPS